MDISYFFPPAAAQQPSANIQAEMIYVLTFRFEVRPTPHTTRGTTAHLLAVNFNSSL